MTFLFGVGTREFLIIEIGSCLELTPNQGEAYILTFGIREKLLCPILVRRAHMPTKLTFPLNPFWLTKGELTWAC